MNKNYLDSVSSLIFNRDFNFRISEVSVSYWEDLCRFEFLAVGGDRVVYKLDDDKVVKFAANTIEKDNDYKNEWEQNKKEIEVYNKASEKQKEYLAEILDYGNNKKWIVTPYYENILNRIHPDTSIEIESQLISAGIKFQDGYQDLSRRLLAFSKVMNASN